MIGQSVGNYVIKERIAAGGTGVVYLAEHPRIQRRVAVKLLHPELNAEPNIVERFFLEAKAANEIHNEHIIEILDFGELPSGAPYFIMEWLDGRSLATLLRTERRLSAERTIRIALGVCSALSAAHARGIVHRDLKPDNIFLIQRGDDLDFAKVLDFGIAKLLQAESEARVYKTDSGSIIGTPAYMSPEQCRAAHGEIDPRSDIYSFGAILYEMLTGVPPFQGKTVPQMLIAHMTATPEPPRWSNPDIPPALEQIILRALEKEPSRRFPDIAALRAGLEAARRDAGTVGAPVPASIASRPSAPVVSMPDTLQDAVTTTKAETVERRRRYYWGTGLAVAASIGLAWFGVRHMTKGEPTPAVRPAAPVAIPPAPVSDASVPPPAVAPVPVEVRVMAAPPDAAVPLKQPDTAGGSRTKPRRESHPPTPARPPQLKGAQQKPDMDDDENAKPIER